MRAWVIKTGEPIPFLPSESNERLFRSGLMAKYLVEYGFQVTWWTSQFHHQLKMVRDVPTSTVYQPDESGPELIFLPSQGYTRHVSLQRFLHHRNERREFKRLAQAQPRPDVIISAWPTIDLSYGAIQYGAAHDVPVVLDVRDLWPDILYERIKAKTGLPFKGYFWPWEYMGKRAVNQAEAIVSITKGMLDWTQTRFGRASYKNDRVFYQCQPSKRVIPDFEYWRAQGIDLHEQKTRLVWSGTLSANTDLVTLLHAIERLPTQTSGRLEFVFCGSGELEQHIAGLAKKAQNVKFAGWVSQSALAALYEHSHIGMICYLDRFDFQLSIPNKAVDFCRFGMKILTNLTGELKNVFGKKELLIPYETGSVDNLCKQFIYIADNPDQFRTKTEKAYELFDDQFNADAVMPRFAKFVEQIAADGCT